MAYKIILDPGHGGSDPGATFNGRQEKDEALGLAMSVGKLLENAGFDVAYTRTTDAVSYTHLDVYKRQVLSKYRRRCSKLIKYL